METQITIFNNPQFGDIRTAGTADNPLFCLKDVCNAIDIANQRNVTSRLDTEDVQLVDTPTNGGSQSMTYVTEGGLYDAIVRSDSPKAKPFRKWVTHEILPSIRKTGGYIATNANMTDAEILAKAVLVAQSTIEKRNERIKELETDNENKTKQIEAAQPSITFTQAVSGSASSCLIGELAKLIGQNGYPMGEKRLFKWMRENGYLGTKGERYNIPNQRYIDMGLFELKKGVRTGNGGVLHTTITTKCTGKGQVYFVNKFKPCQTVPF
ncbi:MAG: phage antirepressor KilAC domain-containing protein [Prevotella sp.]|nr:phage antirepressor KilAC domain-containing protein [Prevotella sp.]